MPFWDGMTFWNYGTFLLVRHTLNGATILGNFHITAPSYITLHTRSICKERCIEMCQDIHNTTFLEHNEYPLSIAKMVYTKVVFGKAVDCRTIKIRPKSNMITSMEQFIGRGSKFLHGRLDKKMAIKEMANELVVWSDTSTDNKHIGCNPLERHLIDQNQREDGGNRPQQNCQQ